MARTALRSVLHDLRRAGPGAVGERQEVEEEAFEVGKESVYEVILWDHKTGEVKRTFPDLTEWVHVVAFSPDGKTLAVCGGGAREEGQAIKTSGEIRLLSLDLEDKKKGESR